VFFGVPGIRSVFGFHDPSTDASAPFRMLGRFTPRLKDTALLSCSAAQTVGVLALFRLFSYCGHHQPGSKLVCVHSLVSRWKSRPALHSSKTLAVKLVATWEPGKGGAYLNLSEAWAGNGISLSHVSMDDIP
jgi:hypothetical protein